MASSEEIGALTAEQMLRWREEIMTQGNIMSAPKGMGKSNALPEEDPIAPDLRYSLKEELIDLRAFKYNVGGPFWNNYDIYLTDHNNVTGI